MKQVTKASRPHFVTSSSHSVLVPPSSESWLYTGACLRIDIIRAIMSEQTRLGADMFLDMNCLNAPMGRAAMPLTMYDVVVTLRRCLRTMLHTGRILLIVGLVSPCPSSALQ
ncbi:hypothetical protein A0H81_02758 [Grifola frondosa]|uniref:Uncharacterized protein n=1 Tax=Grifola frondosa TaxID=5627 RepID=A0A1C7MMI8_GRIFR|nr:hypothetical protein A0H81_02758 [Grifola frondosa]